MKVPHVKDIRNIVLVLVFCLAAASAGAEMINRIVAVVNDDAITSYQLDKRLATVPEEQREALRLRYFDGLFLGLLQIIFKDYHFLMLFIGFSLQPSNQK